MGLTFGKMNALGRLILITSASMVIAKERRAFITVVTSDDDVEPAMATVSTLRASTRSKYHEKNSSYSLEFICLVLPKTESNRSRKNEEEGIELLSAKKLEFSGWNTRPLSYSIINLDADEKDGWGVIDYNLIWIWSLIDFDKIIYLEKDIIILKDLSKLFELDIWHDAYPFSAAPKMIESHKFDRGVMVTKPDMTTFSDMLTKVKIGDVPSDGVESFLNAFYSNWYSLSSVHRLDPTYNAPYEWTKLEGWLKYRSDIKMIRFSGQEKPWNILKNPSSYQVTKYGAPLVYVWAILMYFIAHPLDDGFEDETRYVMTKVFDITKTSEDVAAYIEKMKRGGARLRLGLYDGESEEF